MGVLYGLIKRIFKLIIYFLLFVTLITVIPNLPPYTKFSSIQITPAQDRSGALAPNDELNNVQKLYEGKILGPEALQIWNNEIYTSLATGEIVKLSPGGHVTFVTKIGQPCTGLVQEHICGRPLGFEIDEKNGVMYVADAYHGIWKVDLKTDKKQQLASPNVPLSGRKPQFFNALTVDKNGGVYWTDSSSDYIMKDGLLVGLSDPSGRLFYFDPVKNENKVLLDDLWFPNGVALSSDGSFVVLAETLKHRLLKYYISGPKKGKSEVFIDGLPGAPDNLRALPDGSGIQIALYSALDENNPMITGTLAKLPVIRKFLARISRLIEIPVEYLNSQFPNPVFEDIVYRIGHISSASALAPEISGLVVADWNGKIIQSYYNTDKSVKHISDAVVYNDKLIMGAPHIQNFVAAVPAPPLLQKAYSRNIKQGTTKKPVESTTTTPVPQTKSSTTKEKVTPPQKEKVISPLKEKVYLPTKENVTPPPKEKVTPPPKEKVTPPPKEKVTPAPTEKVTLPSKAAEVRPKKVEKVNSSPKKETSSPNVNKEAKSKTETSTEKPKTTNTPENKATTQKPASKPIESDKTKIDKTNEIPLIEKPAKKEKDGLGKKAGSAVPMKDSVKHIPIVEEIVSDTAKPSKEKLKVITKSGPGEIPSPHI